MRKTEEKYYCDCCGEYISTEGDGRYQYFFQIDGNELLSDYCPSCAKQNLEKVDDERLVQAMESLKELYYHCLNRKSFPEIKDKLEKYYGESIDKLLEEVYVRI